MGQLAASVSTTIFSTEGALWMLASSMGAKPASTKITRSSALLMIQQICSDSRRGFRVWQTAPIPMMPYQTSRWREVFQARVPTLSPGWIPRSMRALEVFLARASTSA